MKVPFSWLREFVDVSVPAADVARTMSVRGFALEGIDTLPDGDAVLDFEVTANRPDAMSIRGIAREVATAYDVPLRPVPEVATLGTVESGADLTVRIDRPDLCPRYVGATASVSVRVPQLAVGSLSTIRLTPTEEPRSTCNHCGNALLALSQ